MNRPLGVLLLAWAAVGGCAREVSPTPGGAAEVMKADALDALDFRAPVPLLPIMAHHQKQNMRDHLVAVQEIVGAIAIADFSAVERAAQRIGFSNQMGQTCEHMGAGAPGFSAQAMAFHHTADRVVEAARMRDRDAVMRELDATLTGCTSCHAAWKQQVVDEQSWKDLMARHQESLTTPMGRGERRAAPSTN